VRQLSRVDGQRPRIAKMLAGTRGEEPLRTFEPNLSAFEGVQIVRASAFRSE
jgi:hypothetical protein